MYPFISNSSPPSLVLASMHHSNICSYVESFLNAPKNNVLYIVMDYADGGDLSGAISRRKKSRRPFTEVRLNKERRKVGRRAGRMAVQCHDYN